MNFDNKQEEINLKTEGVFIKIFILFFFILSLLYASFIIVLDGLFSSQIYQLIATIYFYLSLSIFAISAIISQYYILKYPDSEKINGVQPPLSVRAMHIVSLFFFLGLYISTINETIITTMGISNTLQKSLFIILNGFIISGTLSVLLVVKNNLRKLWLPEMRRNEAK